MLINFCNSGLVTKISSSACESEGYSVSNLISKVDSERKKGFLVDYFIKPPITIELEFLGEIQLSHIILWPQIGSQKTVGVELLTRNCDDKVFCSAGNAFINGGEAGFLFCRHGDKKIETLVNRDFLIRSFKSTKFLRTKILQIKILRTRGSSVPALQRVEIWGKLSRNSSKEIISKVMDIWNNVTGFKITQSSFNNEENINSDYDKLSLTVSNRDLNPVNPSQFIIPDEFLDPISCEIMITPMILPSGKVVDNSTLERFIKEEATWGRFPSDPFTGKLFIPTSRPVISVALKTRIDKFLLDNSNELYCKTLPRTVGGITSVNQAKVSSLVSPVVAKSEDSSKISILRNDNDGNLSSEYYDHRIKKRKLSSFGDNSSLMEKNTSNFNLEGNECQDPVRETGMQKSIDLQKYDEIKKKSLECVLKSTLSSLPSFTTISNSDNDKILCVKCNSVNVLYELPCKHHVCRSCLSFLIQSNSFKCTLCLKKFQTGDPKRIHIMNQV